jgi:hypothetical protein
MDEKLTINHTLPKIFQTHCAWISQVQSLLDFEPKKYICHAEWCCASSNKTMRDDQTTYIVKLS